MSVLKRKRNISKMEFYHNAIKLRLMMTEFLLRDFGIKSRRRNYQTQAICNCENLLQEMQYIIYVCHPNVEKYMKYVDMIEKEILLLKGWRKSDNKIFKELENKDNQG